MEEIDPSDIQQRRQRLTEILGEIVTHADQQSLMRCPYKNRSNQCTALFGCRYQRQGPDPQDLLQCTSDDQLDYRSAWDSGVASVEQLRAELQAGRERHATQAGAEMTQKPLGRVAHGPDACALRVGETLFHHADDLGLRVPSSCGRSGSCHECIVEVRTGAASLSDRSEAESFLKDPYRLACQAIVRESAEEISISLLRRAPQILTASRAVTQADWDPVVMRRGAHVVYDGEVVDDYQGRVLGLAIDVGTTTVAMEVIDLESGQPLATVSFENPQRFGGSDVIHRISYDGGPHRGELHRAIISTLNREIQQVCETLQVSQRNIYEIVVVGNSTMRDLFFDLDVQSIGQKPYKSAIEHAYLAGQRDSTALIEWTRRLRLRAHKQARVYGAPLIASHVGADVVANLVAIDMPSQRQTVMVVDAGTNTEVVLGNSERLMAASCPAGPAFEGGLVRFGMPGCAGAIESLRWEPGGFQHRTIGGVSPVGICGSGLIELMAELRRHNLMTPKGVFADKQAELMIVPECGITISRADVSHLAQAKAANYCGQIMLMRQFGVSPAEIDRLYLAGGFANYVDPVSATEIGFLAPVPADRVVKIGNAALHGARLMLLSKRRRDGIGQLLKKIEHVELETMADFFDMFVDGCQFKPMPNEFPGESA